MTSETTVLPPLPVKIVKITFLDGKPVAFNQSAEGVRLTVPQVDRRIGDTVVKLTLANSAMEIAPIAYA